MIWAVLPLKDFINAKQRLSGVLAPHERRNLFQAMVEDVLQALSDAQSIAHVLLISDDPAAEMLATKYRAVYLRENNTEKTGLNAAVEQAADYLRQQSADTMLVIHGDLPLTSVSELETICACHRRMQERSRALQPQSSVPVNHTGYVTIAPDAEAQGSNVMLCTPANAIPFCYGIDSCARHRDAANDSGSHFQTVSLPGLAMDVDSPADLLEAIRQLNEHHPHNRSWNYLQDSGIASRIKSMGIGDGGIGDGSIRDGCIRDEANGSSVDNGIVSGANEKEESRQMSQSASRQTGNGSEEVSL